MKEEVDYLVQTSLNELPPKLDTLSQRWDRPRGDLCHWIPLLNRFDELLQGFVSKYQLETSHPNPRIWDDGEDEVLAISILKFSAFLLDNCTNRGIYPSIKSVSHFLPCLSPYIVSAALSVCVKLANRFAQSRTGKSSVTAADPEIILRLATFLPTSHWESADSSEIALEKFIDPNFKWDQQWNILTLQYFFKGQPKKCTGQQQQNIGGISALQTTPTRTANRSHQSFPAQLDDNASPKSSDSNKTAATTSSTISPSYFQEGLNTLTIGAQEVIDTPICDLVDKVNAIIPKDYQFSALNKIRLVKSCINTEEGYKLRLELCKIQLLAFGFAVCTFSESTVESRILAHEPNFLRQLGKLIAIESWDVVPPELSILALETMQDACHQAARRTEVLTALSANVSHGTLMSIIRVLIRDMKAGASINEDFAVNIFVLTLQIASTQTLSNMMVSAGIIPLLLELIQIPSTSFRLLSSVMELLDFMIIGSSNNYSSFSQVGGVATLIEVIKLQTESALHDDSNVVINYAKVDYKLPFHRSQWVRSLFVAVSNILVNSSTSESIHTILDSSLLHSIKIIIDNPTVFGSRIVYLTFQILCSMLENEPSSFSVMYEGKFIDGIVDMFPILLKTSNSYMSSIIKFVGAMAHNENGLALIQDRDLLTNVLTNFTSDILRSDSLTSIGNIFDNLVTEHANLRPIVVKECIKFLDSIPDAIESMSKPDEFYLESELPLSENEKQNIEKNILRAPEAITVMENLSKFLEGMLRNHLTRAEFIEQKGFSRLIDLFVMKCMPYDYAFSSVGYSLGKVARTLFTLDIQSDHIEDSLLDLVDRHSSQTKEIMETIDWNSPILTHLSTDSEALESVMRSIATLNGSLQAFFEVVFFEVGTGYRILDILRRVVKSRVHLIHSLAFIQRWCMWQEAMALDNLSADLVEATKPLPIDMNRSESEDYKAIKEAESKLEDIDSRFVKNVKLFRFLTSSNSVMISKILAEFSSNCTNERSMDTHKKDGLHMAALIGDAMIKNLNFAQLDEISTSTGSALRVRLQALVSFLASMQKIMLKSWSGASSFYLGVFVMFKQNGGIERLMDIFHLLWKRSTDPELKEEPLLIFSQKVLLVSIGFTISYRSVLENNRLVSPLATREYQLNEPDYFNPNQFFVECRILLIYKLVNMWKPDELLATLHPQVVKLFLDILIKLFTFTGEDGASKLPKDNLPRVLTWTQIPPRQDDLNALVELGFDEDLASQMLLEHHNHFDSALNHCLISTHKTRDDLPNINYTSKTRFKVGNIPEVGGRRLVRSSDLNELRDEMKQSLIDGLLELVQNSPETVFTAATLITKMYSPMGGPRIDEHKELLSAAHRDIYMAISARIESFNMNGDSSEIKKLAACIHLLGLLLQELPFMQSCFPLLIANASFYIDIISAEGAHKKDYYPHCLLIIERVLTSSDIPEPVPRNFIANFPDMFTSVTPRIPVDECKRLFDSISIPRHFESDLSALAISRICLHFAKDRSFSQILLQNGMIQHLLLAVKKFSSSSNLEKLQTAIMILLRYCVETPEMIKQNMKNEITAWFSVSKMADAVVFVKSHYMLAARSPELFIEVASELCCFQDYSLNTANICLKEHLENRRKKTLKLPIDIEKEGNAEVDNKESDGKDDNSMVDIKQKDSETITDHNKLFNPEQPSGVIHLLLTQLFSFKRDEIFIKPEKDEQLIDFEDLKDPKTSKNAFGPSFVYSHFILSILAELLASYSQCKLEFVHFTKKSSLPFPSTPNKFRSYPLQYLLQELIPVPIMNDRSANVATQEWIALSNLATTVILNLMAATDELGKDIAKDKVQNFPPLVFVRKLTLDALAKSLRDVLSNNETIDWKCSALSNISDLCYRSLSNRSITLSSSGGDLFADGASIAKIMYDKKFVSVFTSYLGELDLNYPQSRRVIRVAVRFLNKLSRLALEISEDLTNQAQDDGDEDLEDDSFEYREETPDLFRNSTLGMFEVDDDYNDDGELDEEEDILEHSSDEDRMEYDEVNDEALSDVDDEESEGIDSIEFDEDDEESEGSDEDEDDEMGVCSIINFILLSYI